MLHYVRNRYQIVDGHRVAMGAVCGDQNARMAMLTLSDVASIVDCPKCQDEIRRLEASDPEKLKTSTKSRRSQGRRPKSPT